MRHSTRFAYLSVLFLLFLAQSTKAQTLQSDESVIGVARELANTYSKTVSIVAERLFGSFLPQPHKAAPFMQVLAGRFQEIYVEVATPVFASRMTAEEIRILTEEFQAPVFQTFTAALAEAMTIWMPCMMSELGALPKPPEPPSEEQHRLARQLWMLQQEANSPPQTSAEPAHPRLPKKIQGDMDRFQEEWHQRSNCMDDGATAVLAKRLTVEELKTLIALEQSQPLQKLNSVIDEVHEKLGPKLAAEFQKIFGLR